jgi:glycosyltransferase involved in cell wall biosynthesis
MDVSIVIPTRNRSELLSRTLRSALRQERVEFEIIVVDEASTDDTPVLLASLQDPRVRVLRHETARGLSGARNHGAEQARGEWLGFLDDDDLWAPDKLNRQVSAARAARRDWSYTGAVNIANGQIVHSGATPAEEEVVSTVSRYPILPGGGSNVVVRRETFATMGGFDRRLANGGEDWELWIRLAAHGWPAGVLEPLMAKRIHASNMFGATERIVEAVTIIQQLHGNPIDWRRMHRWLAERYAREGRWLSMASELAKAAVLGELGAATVLLPHLRWRLRQTLGLRPAAPSASSDGRAAMAAAWLREFEDIEEATGV